MSYDWLEVGAGPAGAAAGLTAARAGARVLVVDRSIFPKPKTCGDAMSNGGAEVVDRIVGEKNALSRVSHAVVHGAVAVFPDGARIRRGFGGHDGYIVPRHALDGLLRAQLEGAGAEVREGARVERKRNAPSSTRARRIPRPRRVESLLIRKPTSFGSGFGLNQPVSGRGRGSG